MSLLPVHEALSRLLALAPKERRMEIVNLAAAEGRVLAHDVAARLTHPAFDNSAMDGYAGRHEDLAETGAELRVVGQSAAGHGFAGKVAAGEVVRIFTGAPIPAGADTVLAQEDAEPLGDGRIRTHLRDPSSGLSLAVWQERGVMHAFTADTVSRDARRAIALEPMECMADAFNRPECAEAIRLLPGAERSFRCGVEVRLP